ncbi:hypothetical protein [Turneriella parva]|uniref:Uncharacterized protein n=1 Tax=Turneriella parva (strain ATCC BAA-1111 / DSM 21527 / NCTC 11395 / H) TaxID=869212 RepID=I4B5Z9_TURPD|nr:hypothetical protein [Turneriella parva]AFM12706.1 hypothetical protein Turpa_2060 [Turneriella parva DSM 21527]
MRIFVLSLVVTTTVLWAQAGRPPGAAPTSPRPAAASPARPATATPGSATAPKPATAGNPAPTSGPGSTGNSNNNNGGAKIEGFDGIAWGMSYKEMKDRFRVMASNANAADNVEIISDNPDREILIRRREIYYRYVFYKKPAAKAVESMPKPETGKPAEKPATDDPTAGTAKFFFVESIFPLLKAEELYGKLSEKYGQRTGSSVGETMRGAHTWEKEEGFLVQWVEPYAKMGYTRSLYYLSRKIRDEIKGDLQAWQFVREIKALESLLK